MYRIDVSHNQKTDILYSSGIMNEIDLDIILRFILLIIPVLIYLAVVFAIGSYAERRGRDAGWAFWAFVLTPPIAFCILALRDVRTEANSSLKKCPMCAEAVRREALLCHFCRSEFAPSHLSKRGYGR